VIEGVLGLGGTYKYLRDVFCTFCCLSAKIIFFFVSSDWELLGLQVRLLDFKLCIVVFVGQPRIFGR
jgi:hypothetical protein